MSRTFPLNRRTRKTMVHVIGLMFWAYCSVIAAFGSSAMAQAQPAATRKVHRVGQLAKIQPDRVDALKQSYQDNRDGIRAFLNDYQLENFSIYVKELEPGQPYLFKYYEYTGDDYAAVLKNMREDPRLQQWEQRFWAEYLEKPTPDALSPWIDMEEVFFFAGRDDVHVADSDVQRYAMVIGGRPEMVEGYKQLHAHPWQGVLDAIRKGNLRNYPIYLTKLGDKVYIFTYFEYVGNDFEADMKKIDSEPVTLAWMKFTDEACQLPLETRADGEWWANMEEVVSAR
ncbi:MAG: L-rhamnose mutarotase [Aeoliella sp.]